MAVGRMVNVQMGTVAFDWGMTVSDTSLPKALAPNVVIRAKVIGSSFPDADGSEGIEGMLNGTITSLSDKWSSAQLRWNCRYPLTQPRTIVRWSWTMPVLVGICR